MFKNDEITIEELNKMCCIYCFIACGISEIDTHKVRKFILKELKGKKLSRIMAGIRCMNTECLNPIWETERDYKGTCSEKLNKN